MTVMALGGTPRRMTIEDSFDVGRDLGPEDVLASSLLPGFELAVAAIFER